MIECTTILLAAILFVLTIFFYYLLDHDKNPRHVEFAKKFPGPRSLPFIGTSWDFRGDGQELYAKLLEYIEKYKSPFRLWFGSHLMIVVSESEDLEAVFASSKLLGRPKLFEGFQDVFGHSIFTEHVASIWKKNRKMLQIPLVPNILHTYVPIINEKVKLVADNMLSKHIDGEEFIISNYVIRLAFDIVTGSLYNLSSNLDNDTGELVHNSSAKGVHLSFIKMLKPWLRLIIPKWIIKRESAQLGNILHSFAKKVTDETMPQLLREQEESKPLHNDESAPKSMLNILYEISKGGQDMKQVQAEIIALTTGGTSTVSITLEFLFWNLAVHQDIQNKVYEEIYQVFGDSDRDADENDMRELTYLEQVVKETLRRFSLATMLFRLVEKDCKIGEHVYPEGTGLIIYPIGTHYNPKYYPDPFKFNPDNFSAEAIENRPKHTFLPFGAGARICIGAAFALLELKMMVCGLLRKYKFYTNMKMGHDLKFQASLMITGVEKCKVSIKRRKETKQVPGSKE